MTPLLQTPSEWVPRRSSLTKLWDGLHAPVAQSCGVLVAAGIVAGRNGFPNGSERGRPRPLWACELTREWQMSNTFPVIGSKAGETPALRHRRENHRGAHLPERTT